MNSQNNLKFGNNNQSPLIKPLKLNFGQKEDVKKKKFGMKKNGNIPPKGAQTARTMRQEGYLSVGRSNATINPDGTGTMLRPVNNMSTSRSRNRPTNQDLKSPINRITPQ